MSTDTTASVPSGGVNATPTHDGQDLEAPVATILRPLVETLFGGAPPLRFRFWDGSSLGPLDGPGSIEVRSPDAVRRLVWAPGELGLARAFVTGDIGWQGDLVELLRVLQAAAPERPRFSPSLLRAAGSAARELGVLGGPLPAPPEEARPAGRRHSRRRDARSVSHHYDVGNDFYRLLLGPSLTYSCARFAEPATTLEEAQSAKHELVCRKLGLHERPGARLLDVGCGWGSMALHAAVHHGAEVVGVTVSEAQADLARKRVAAAGMTDRVEIRLQDYRDVDDGPFDAVSSIGMFEHVGRAQMGAYLEGIRSLLRPGGRLLNHAISSPTGSELAGSTFMGRYVFPDADIIPVGDVVVAMEAAGLEVRDVESLREHYARTLRAWIANLQAARHEVVELVGERRLRVWLLYLAGCTVAFEDGGIAVHQVLGVLPTDDGRSLMPATRAGWEPAW